ncbi:MAG: hypothetical protein HOH19_07260 [Kordiimonadaceae bacterium]|nr:hypothetical protein [Kordiimonadaceae bacterium]MBT6032357.1 hypothetical protein [Kordiimonadaceae bacterium]
MKLPQYILNSILGSWKFVQAKPSAMEYLDQSSDGFWKSFWAIAVMAPVFVLWAIFNTRNEVLNSATGIEISYPFLSEGIFFIIALPFTAFVMIYFTKFMKISENYSSMVIAYNWVSAMIYVIMALITMILLSGFISEQISAIILMMIRFYFGFYVLWFTLKSSLKIGGFLSFGVLIFVKLLDTSLLVILYQIFNPEYFEAIFAMANSQPS